MSKVAEFYAKAVADGESKAELIKILGDKTFAEASDEQLAKVGELAKKLGYDITVEEAKTYLNPEEEALGEEDLDAVAGGKGGGSVTCNNGVGTIDVDVM